MTAEQLAPNLPDVEAAVRAWLRDKVAGVGGRVFFGHPDGATYPYLTVSRIGGAPRGDIDEARLSVHSWGSTKKSASDVATSVARAVDGLGTEVIATGVLAHGGVVDSLLWLPAAPDDRPRYVVDITVHASVTEAEAG